MLHIFERRDAHPSDVHSRKSRDDVFEIRLTLTPVRGERGEHQVGRHAVRPDGADPAGRFAKVGLRLNGHAQVREFFFGALFHGMIEIGARHLHEVIERGRHP